MGKRPRAAFIAWLAALVIVAAACTPLATASSSPGLAVTPQANATATDPPRTTGPAPAAGRPTELPQDLWRTALLRDVRTGAIVSVNDLLGQLVVIEPMAIWCSTCRIQQDEARDALASLDRDDIAYISLGVDPSEEEASLAAYADDGGYSWYFVVASVDVARSLAATFGDQVLAPPSTPKIVVAPDGSTTISFGIKSAAQLQAELLAIQP